MAQALNKYKSYEQELQNVLYENIRLITNFYPTTKEFDLVFKKDMFAKNNKSGFFQVVYYLLTTLNPILTKTRITNWPVYDLKMESKFRSELLNYVNELNSIYETAKIPPVMASQLISPSGYRFLLFMVKLSELVIVEHLLKNNMEFLMPINMNIDESYVNSIKTKTQIIEAETSKKLEEYYDLSSEINQQACNIVTQLDKFEFEVKQLKNELDKLKKERPNESVDDIIEELHKLNEKATNLRQIQHFIEESSVLYGVLSREPITLKSEDEKEVDLTEYLNHLTINLNKLNLELPNPLKSNLEKYTEKINATNVQLSFYQQQLQEKRELLLKAIKKINT